MSRRLINWSIPFAVGLLAIVASAQDLERAAPLRFRKSNFKPTVAAGSGIAIDLVSTNAQEGGTSITVSHTCTGANLALVVLVAMEGDATTVSGVTYNSVSMTQLWQVDNSGGVGAKHAAFILINPATGAHNTVATFSGTSGGYTAIACHSYTGVAQGGGAGTSWRTPVTGGVGGGGMVTLTLSTAVSGDMVIEGIGNYNTDLSAPNGTYRSLTNNIGTGVYDHGTQDKLATGSTTLTYSGGDFWSGGIFSLIPAP